jgi:hypothetical protein
VLWALTTTTTLARTCTNSLFLIRNSGRSGEKYYTYCLCLYFSLLFLGGPRAGVSIFFGSLPASPILNRLDVYVIDLDHGFLGTQIINGFNASFQAQPNGLRWSFDAIITSPADAQAVVLDERAWAVVQGIRLFLRTRVQFLS